MKGVITKIVAMLLVLWYSMSIIGFDIHTCHGSGRSFVVTFIEGTACEDIHPEHQCHAHSCCEAEDASCCHHNNDEPSVAASSCCSNEYQVLALTGVLSSDDHRHYDACGCGCCPYVDLYTCDLAHDYRYDSYQAYIKSPDSGLGVVWDVQTAFNVWRI